NRASFASSTHAYIRHLHSFPTRRSSDLSERQGSNQVDLVTDYLEKLIQIPYYLPRLSASEIETYISLLFCQLRLGNDFKHVHDRSEEHTSELQSRENLVCRLLLEKKKQK